MYTAYLLDDDSREQLLAKFAPKFEKTIAHHVTVEFGVGKDAVPPEEAVVKAIGYVSDGHDIEAIVISVNGEAQKPDGNFYHITWSLNPENKKPVDSNGLIGYGSYQLILPIELNTTPSVEK